MIKHYQNQAGFTAVEVLVTLFIGVVLLGGGYQAYGAVINNTERGRTQSIASNIAYEALRREADNTSAQCSPVAERNLTWQSTYNTTLPQPRSIRGSVSCPYGNGNRISLISVRVTYGQDSESVTHAIYSR